MKHLLVSVAVLFSLTQAAALAAPVEAWKAHFQKGDQSLKQGLYSVALREYDRALELNPNSWEVYLHKAKVYEKMGMPQRVIEAYDQAMSLHPRQERVWMERSDYFFRKGMAAQGLYDLEEGLRYLPNNANLRYTRALYYLQQKDYGKAMEDLSVAVTVKPLWVEAQLQKAELHRLNQDVMGYEQALSMAVQGSIQSKREVPLSWYLSRAKARSHLWLHYMSLNQTAMAMKMVEGEVADYSMALARYPAAKQPLELYAARARGYLLLTNYYGDLKDAKRQNEVLDKALADYNTLIKRNPKDSESLYFRGEIYLALEMCEKALADLNRACKLGNKKACYQEPPCTPPKKEAPADTPAGNTQTASPSPNSAPAAGGNSAQPAQAPGQQ